MNKKWFEIFSRPFPDNADPWLAVRGSGIIAIFVTIFLFVFKPFGLSALIQDRFWVCLGFGLITFLISAFYEMVILNRFRIARDGPHWTFGKWLISTFLLIILIASGNYGFYLLITHNAHSWTAFLIVIYNTGVIAIFPIFFIGYVRLISAEKHYKKMIGDMRHFDRESRKSDPVTITDPSGNNYTFNSSNLVSIEALQNYIRIIYIEQDLLDQRVIRMTMKEVESQIDNASIFRCHRSYIVNSRLISEIEGNAQGLSLIMDTPVNYAVPVSRKFISRFRS